MKIRRDKIKSLVEKSRVQRSEFAFDREIAITKSIHNKFDIR